MKSFQFPLLLVGIASLVIFGALLTGCGSDSSDATLQALPDDAAEGNSSLDDTDFWGDREDDEGDDEADAPKPPASKPKKPATPATTTSSEKSYPELKCFDKALTAGTVGAYYKHQLKPTGGSKSYKLSSNELPKDGLELRGMLITGMPTAAEEISGTITVEDRTTKKTLPCSFAIAIGGAIDQPLAFTADIHEGRYYRTALPVVDGTISKVEIDVETHFLVLSLPHPERNYTWKVDNAEKCTKTAQGNANKDKDACKVTNRGLILLSVEDQNNLQELAIDVNQTGNGPWRYAYENVKISATDGEGHKAAVTIKEIVFRNSQGVEEKKEEGRLGTDSLLLKEIGEHRGNVFNVGCAGQEGMQKDGVVSEISLKYGDVLDYVGFGCKRLDYLSDPGKSSTTPRGGGGPGGGGSQDGIFGPQPGIYESIVPPLGFAFIGWKVKVCTNSGRRVIAEFYPIAKKVNGWGVRDDMLWEGLNYHDPDLLAYPGLAYGRGSGRSDDCTEWMSAECPAGTVLTSVTGTYDPDAYVNSLGGTCQKANTYTPKPRVAKVSLDPPWKSDETYKPVDGVGAGGGSKCKISCRDSSHPNGVVVGFNSSFHYDSAGTTQPSEIGLRCGDITTDGVGYNSNFQNTIQARRVGSCGTPGYDEPAILLPAGFVATGIFGRSGKYLDQIGLLPSAIDLFDPHFKTPNHPPGQRSIPAGDPGGGGPFPAISCDENEVLTGIEFRAEVYIDGITGFSCAKVSIKRD